MNITVHQIDALGKLVQSSQVSINATFPCESLGSTCTYAIPSNGNSTTLYNVEVSLNGTHISGSPFAVTGLGKYKLKNLWKSIN